MRVAVILLACVTALVSAQFNQDDNIGQKGGSSLRSTRFQRLPSARPAVPTALANQRIRRPITFRPRIEDSIGTGPGSFTPIKSLKPNLPTGSAASLPPQIKPVNEEPDEGIRIHENSPREHDNQDDDTNISDEPLDSQEESEENIPRTVGGTNLGSISKTANTVSTAQSGQYRSLSGTGSPTTRGSGFPTAPSAPVQYRPASKPNKSRKPIDEPFKQQVKSPTKSVKSSQLYETRGKKPVAQIIRRYRNDNSDGSITWGFENDDGSYKEEIIGIDCITRGKYGYIDPDGIRREYTYETGIKCDEEQREEEENGFVDYQENKLVLPDGKTIDLSSMGKKQARRPRSLQRN
ncbi:hypothetical protein HZU73_03552 [Apis mellifera caucasica]|nr:hypothetical protein HZU73_03552 [Apis mellifera caucasica]